MKRWILAVTAITGGLGAAQDLLPRDVPGQGAAEVEFGAAREVRGWAPDDSPVLVAALQVLVVTGSEAEAVTV